MDGDETIKVMCVIGTRPEAIKLAPVVSALAKHPRFTVRTCLTAQHREMVDDVLQLFGIRADDDLDLMRAGQDLYHVHSAGLLGMRSVLREHPVDWVIVQGDTTTTFVGAMAAFYERIRVAHVEAGLRTNDPQDPFPEEMNRRLVTQIASLHFPPTQRAADNLSRENVAAADVVLTGNTVVDALRWVEQVAGEDAAVDATPMLLVTIHRRENFGAGIERMVSVVRAFAQRRSDWQVLWPVHPNPSIHGVVHAALDGLANVKLVAPLRYDHFLRALNAARVVLTDSGGVQEEAACLGRRVIVARRSTERAEAMDGGLSELASLDPTALLERLLQLSEQAPQAHSGSQVFGDGHAAERIVEALSARC